MTTDAKTPTLSSLRLDRFLAAQGGEPFRPEGGA